MGQKVNYNKNKTNKLKIAGIAILSLLVLLFLIKSMKNMKNNINTPNGQGGNLVGIYTKTEDIKTIEDLIGSYGCRLLKKEEVEGVTKLYVKFDVELYTGQVSNENHFLNISKGVAEFLNYKNFEMIDTSKDIDIEVKCEEPNIVEFKVNDDINYYLNHESDKNKNLSNNSITNFSIQSQILEQLNENNWTEASVNWGTRDSICDGYNIYFDEGIKYKNVARNVYNVIFTEKYVGQVAGSLTVNSTPEQVISSLGQPTFSNFEQVYGYVGNDNYLFFDFLNNQISVYPVKKISEEDEKKLNEYVNKMNEKLDIKEFANNLTKMWLDYDVYDYDSNYVDLRYTLRGIKLAISSDSLKNGIFIYKNYSGDRLIADLDNVYNQSEDLVFETEKERVLLEKLNRNEEGSFSEDYYKIYLGNKFSVRMNSYRNVRFYSRDNEYPDSELEKNIEISSYIWYDDFNFIYSIEDDGIYVYNCITKENSKIIELKGEISINSVSDGKIIYNDNQVLNIVEE